MNTAGLVKEELLRLGFATVGVTSGLPPAHLDVYRSWIDAGRHAEMHYLASERAFTARADPGLVLSDCKSVIVAALKYPFGPVPLQPPADHPRGKIASYAWGIDYHNVIPERLRSAAQHLQTLLGNPVTTRAYTDTGPVMEREFAQRAGLGWIGKHTCLIQPELGSYFLLGELFTSASLVPDEPFVFDRCGSCRRCIDACPTGCIRPDRTLDARECISYLTIENKGAIPASLRSKLGSWIFGCDVCQQVCPWNQRFASVSGSSALQPNLERAAPVLLAELHLTPLEFNKKYRLSPLKRAKRRGYLRNIAVALGNSGDRAAVPALIHTLFSEDETLVRAHAAWALGSLGSQSARTALETALKRETDPEILGEISAALLHS